MAPGRLNLVPIRPPCVPMACLGLAHRNPQKHGIVRDPEKVLSRGPRDTGGRAPPSPPLSPSSPKPTRTQPWLPCRRRGGQGSALCGFPSYLATNRAGSGTSRKGSELRVRTAPYGRPAETEPPWPGSVSPGFCLNPCLFGLCWGSPPPRALF